ncbi:MAG TPA: bacterial transcriptional activator domain-containing protein, partial [Chloroflexota bacterium]|nr:bacterial transcriptional activator domain-containing protein [Chloroflexota bacterium]
LWLDAAEFERLLAQADRLFKRDPATAVSLYRQALALYDGDYLQAYPYYDWASAEQERLLTLYLRSSERLAQALAAQAAWAEVATVCQAILSHDDCWEEAYRLLMLAYDGLGNRAQALQTYERCRETLQRKWGVEPMPDTVQIYEGIRQSSP